MGAGALTGSGGGSQAEGLKVADVVVLIDRQQGGAARMASNGLRLHSAFTLSFILDVLVRPCALLVLQAVCSAGKAQPSQPHASWSRVG